MRSSPAADESTAIRPAEVLGAEADEIGSLGIETAHELDGVVHVGGVDEGGDAVLPPDGRYLASADGAVVTIEMGGQRRMRGVSGRSPARSLRGRVPASEPTSTSTLRQQRAAVVLVAMAALQDDLVRHAGGLGQPLDLLPVVAGETGADARGRWRPRRPGVIRAASTPSIPAIVSPLRARSSTMSMKLSLASAIAAQMAGDKREPPRSV